MFADCYITGSYYKIQNYFLEACILYKMVWFFMIQKICTSSSLNFFFVMKIFLQNSKLEHVSLWHVEMFPVLKSCTESVFYAIKMLDALKNGTKIDKGNIMPVGKYLSMKEILDLKDTERTLHIREKLRKKILGTC